MRLSEKRESALYDAIREPLMRARIANKKRAGQTSSFRNVVDADEVDAALFNLETEIWRRVCDALGVECR